MLRVACSSTPVTTSPVRRGGGAPGGLLGSKHDLTCEGMSPCRDHLGEAHAFVDALLLRMRVCGSEACVRAGRSSNGAGSPERRSPKESPNASVRTQLRRHGYAIRHDPREHPKKLQRLVQAFVPL